MTSPTTSFASILAALDDSPRAPLVFATAVELARCTNGRVSLVRVLTEPTDIPPAANTHPDHVAPIWCDLSRPSFAG